MEVRFSRVTSMLASSRHGWDDIPSRSSTIHMLSNLDHVSTPSTSMPSTLVASSTSSKLPVSFSLLNCGASGAVVMRIDGALKVRDILSEVADKADGISSKPVELMMGRKADKDKVHQEYNSKIGNVPIGWVMRVGSNVAARKMG